MLAPHIDTWAPVCLKAGDGPCRAMMVCIPRNNDLVRSVDGRLDAELIDAVEPLDPEDVLTRLGSPRVRR